MQPARIRVLPLYQSDFVEYTVRGQAVLGYALRLAPK